MTIKILHTKSRTTISKYIYGHFAEHLGRCIYEGLYVGEDSPIPNKNGMRIDVVEALKTFKSLCCVGQAAASPMNIIGKTGLVLKKTAKRWSTLTGAA